MPTRILIILAAIAAVSALAYITAAAGLWLAAFFGLSYPAFCAIAGPLALALNLKANGVI